MAAAGAGAVPATRYLTYRPAPGARLRLFCFHHAGGSAALYRELREELAPDIDVLPVQLPGREGRVDDVLPNRMDALVAELDEQLDTVLAAPYALYGHSMGALIAYELTRHRIGARPRAAAPELLLLGACRAPHLPNDLAESYQLPDDELADALAAIGGLSPAVLAYPKWLRAAVALTRRDLELCASYRPAAAEPLPCPVHVLSGTGDPLATAAQAAEWAAYTRAGLAAHEIPGGHFFPRESPIAFTDRLRLILADALPGAVRAAGPAAGGKRI